MAIVKDKRLRELHGEEKEWVRRKEKVISPIIRWCSEDDKCLSL